MINKVKFEQRIGENWRGCAVRLREQNEAGSDLGAGIGCETGRMVRDSGYRCKETVEAKPCAHVSGRRADVWSGVLLNKDFAGQWREMKSHFKIVYRNVTTSDSSLKGSV